MVCLDTSNSMADKGMLSAKTTTWPKMSNTGAGKGMLSVVVVELPQAPEDDPQKR